MFETRNTIIKRCSCKNSFQDRVYGKKKRLHNKLSSRKTSSGRARCTVCGKEN